MSFRRKFSVKSTSLEVLFPHTTSGINSVTSTACYVFSWQTYTVIWKSCKNQNIPPTKMFSALPKVWIIIHESEANLQPVSVVRYVFLCGGWAVEIPKLIYIYLTALSLFRNLVIHGPVWLKVYPGFTQWHICICICFSASMHKIKYIWVNCFQLPHWCPSYSFELAIFWFSSTKSLLATQSHSCSLSWTVKAEPPQLI